MEVRGVGGAGTRERSARRRHSPHRRSLQQLTRPPPRTARPGAGPAAGRRPRRDAWGGDERRSACTRVLVARGGKRKLESESKRVSGKRSRSLHFPLSLAGPARLHLSRARAHPHAHTGAHIRTRPSIRRAGDCVRRRRLHLSLFVQPAPFLFMPTTCRRFAGKVALVTASTAGIGERHREAREEKRQ